MSDLISRDDAIMAVKAGALSAATLYGRTDEGSTALYETVRAIKALPSAQPTDIQDILKYLDTVLHPIVSPEHWNIYSELYDMVSVLPSAQPQSTMGQVTDAVQSTKDCISRQAAIDAEDDK